MILGKLSKTTVKLVYNNGAEKLHECTVQIDATSLTDQQFVGIRKHLQANEVNYGFTEYSNDLPWIEYLKVTPETATVLKLKFGI